MRYFRAYGFIFDSPQWLTTLLIGIVCMFVPVVGPMVFMGYLYDVIEALHRDPEQVYPPFDFNRLLDYLVRGVWPFLVQLVVMLPLMLLLMVFVAIPIALAVCLTGEEPSAVVWICIAVASLMVAAGIILIPLVTIPMSLRAGLAQDFGAGFSVAFVRDFIARVWLESILTQLFMLVTAPLLAVMGMAVFCIGQYPAQVWIICAGTHLHYQLYELYLQRGARLSRSSRDPRGLRTSISSCNIQPRMRHE